MVREVKEYDERMDEIIATARRLFFTKGYEATSVSDIISVIGIAKGTFYHYFDSKMDLMLALADQITDEAVAIIAEVTDASDLSAGEKFQTAFSHVGNWKVDNREMMLELLHVMYDPKNIGFLHTLNKMSREKAVPFFARIIKEGNVEGEWETSFPDEMASIIFHMGIGLSQQFGDSFLRMENASDNERREIIETLYHQVEAFRHAINRILGILDDELDLVNFDIVEGLFGRE